MLVSFNFFILSSCSKEPVTSSNFLFDTFVNITLYDGNQEILNEVTELLNKYNCIFDNYASDSSINQVTTVPTTVSPELLELLEKNVEFSKRTNELFSPTLGSLIDLWNIRENEIKEPPSKEQILQALQPISINNLNISGNKVQLLNPETKLNLGASVKGYASDKVKNLLIENGVKSALINLGGNILLVGNKNGQDFTIGIENPNQDGTIGELKLSDKSIVTSGNYQRYFTDSQGNKYHHILDPRTGYPADNDLNEVVVVSDSSLEGDMLATYLFILGKEKAIDFLKSYNNSVEVIFVTKNNEIWLPDNLKENFKLSNDEFKLQFYNYGK